MKKRAGFPSFAESLMPLLPVLPFLTRIQTAVPVLGFVFAVYMFAAGLMRLAGPLFPKKLLPFSFLLGVLFLVTAGVWFLSLSPVVFFSVWLLGFSPVSGKTKGRFFPFYHGRAVFFLVLGLYLSFCQELLAVTFGLDFFREFSGALLLLAVPALVWPRSRKSRGALKRSAEFQEEALLD